MTVTEILQSLETLGLRLEWEGETLHIKGPVGKITTDLRVAITERKPDLLLHHRLKPVLREYVSFAMKWAIDRHPSFYDVERDDLETDRRWKDVDAGIAAVLDGTETTGRLQERIRALLTSLVR